MMAGLAENAPEHSLCPMHNAIECASSQAPLPSLIRQLAWLQGYDLRQSQLIPSFPANSAWEPIESARPCVAAAVINCILFQIGNFSAFLA